MADLEELPDRQRGALVMRELAGLGFEQIGARSTPPRRLPARPSTRRGSACSR